MLNKLNNIKNNKKQHSISTNNNNNTNTDADTDSDSDTDSSDNDNDDNEECNIDIDAENYCCIYCKSYDMIEDVSGGALVCKQCGSVSDDCVENGVELIQYGDDGCKITNRNCAVINKLLPQSSMVTTLKGSCSNIARAIHNWGSIPYHERKLSLVFKFFRKICEKGNISKCIEDDAKIIFKIITDCTYSTGKKINNATNNVNQIEGVDEDLKKIIFRGKNMEGLKIACLNYACRKNKKPFSPKELSKLSGLPIKKITKGNKLFDKFMKINNFTNYSEVSAEYFVTHFFEELNIKQSISNTVIKMIRNIEKIQIANKHTPLSIATGASLLLVKMYDLEITEKMIAKYFNISKVTISKAYKTFEPFKKMLLHDSLCDIVSNKIKTYQTDIYVDDNLKHNFLRFNVDIKNLNIKNNKYEIYDKENKKIMYDVLEQYETELNHIVWKMVDEYFEINIKQIIQLKNDV